MSTAAPAAPGDGQVELVDFRMFEHRPGGGIYEGVYGVSVAKVRRILVLPELSRVPDTHPAVEGIFHLRGVQVPAVNLAGWFQMDEARPEGTPRKVIVCELVEQSLGLIVHQASRIRSVSWASVQPPPPLVIRRHGSSINGTTVIDDGKTLLLVDVEQIVVEVKEEAERRIARQSEAGDGEGTTVLAVDDSTVARGQVCRALMDAGYRVVEAANGQEALRYLEDETARAAAAGVALVVTDVEMPLLDGHGLTRAIRANQRLAGLPVVMHSSLEGGDHERTGREAGCDEYVVKFEAQRLVEAARRQLG